MLRTSSSIVDLIFMKIISHFLRLSLCAPHEAPHVFYEFDFIFWALAPNRVGFDVLVQEFVGVEFRAVSREEEDADLSAVAIRPAFYGGRNMYGMSI